MAFFVADDRSFAQRFDRATVSAVYIGRTAGQTGCGGWRELVAETSAGCELSA